MIKRALLLLVLCIHGLAAAQEQELRTMSLVTQDKNGLFIFMAVAMPGEAWAAARQFGVENGWDTGKVLYPRERFDKLWLEAKELGMTGFKMKTDAGSDRDVGAARTYLISIGNDPQGQVYQVPKCSAPPAIVSFLERLTKGIVPEGSPGLYEPCPDSRPKP